MKTLTISFLLIFMLMSSIYGQAESPVKYGDNLQAGGYKRINNMNMYYEIYAIGRPLILLHGNGGSIRGQGGRIEYFRKYFQVVAIDSRAHGKSIDTTNQPLTYEQMANDIKVLMDSLEIDSAFVWGQSDGGILGLLLAINYPDKIYKLAVFGVNTFPGKKAVYDEIHEMVMDSLKTIKDFQTKRLFNLLAYQPNITDKDLNKIKCPVLIMSGDRDAVRLEHSIRIFNAIQNSNLFVMPGATHYGAYQKPDLFNLVLLDFLNKPFSKLSTIEIMTGKN